MGTVLINSVLASQADEGDARGIRCLRVGEAGACGMAIHVVPRLPEKARSLVMEMVIRSHGSLGFAYNPSFSSTTCRSNFKPPPSLFNISDSPNIISHAISVSQMGHRFVATLSHYAFWAELP